MAAGLRTEIHSSRKIVGVRLRCREAATPERPQLLVQSAGGTTSAAAVHVQSNPHGKDSHNEVISAKRLRQLGFVFANMSEHLSTANQKEERL
jgi:hypothetical protein